MEKQKIDYYTESFKRQIGSMAADKASMEEVIAGMQQRIEELEKENEQLRQDQIKEMDDEAEKEVKKDRDEPSSKKK